MPDQQPSAVSGVAPISARAQDNLRPSPLGAIRSHCFYNQYDPTSNPEGIIALAIAENKLMRDEITAHINDNFRITPWHLTYGEGPQGSTALRNAIARFVNREFGLHAVFSSAGSSNGRSPTTDTDGSGLVKPEHIVLCNGAGSAVNNLCFCLGEPGDGILTGRPFYVGFLPDIEYYAKFKLVGVSFARLDAVDGQTSDTRLLDPLSLEAVDCYERALLEAEQRGTKIRALLLSNPHNPLGRPYSREVLEGYLRLCANYGIHLISDEVYCKSWFPSKDFPEGEVPPFVSVLSLDLAKFIDPSLVHVIYGMSKDFCANGIRIGCLISPYSPTVCKAFKSISSFSRASQLAENVWLNLLQDAEFQGWYFPELQKRMTTAYEYVTEILRQEGIEYSPASVTSFLWVDLRRYLTEPTEDAELALNWRMAREARVWLAMGRSFDAEEPGWFRITFATPKDELETGMTRLIDLLRVVLKEQQSV
jgi:aspartate/methionine/tyrosine aminotransferase